MSTNPGPRFTVRKRARSTGFYVYDTYGRQAVINPLGSHRTREAAETRAAELETQFPRPAAEKPA